MLSDPCLGPGARAFNLFLVVGNIWRKKRGVENININNNTMYKLHFIAPVKCFSYFRSFSISISIFPTTLTIPFQSPRYFVPHFYSTGGTQILPVHLSIIFKKIKIKINFFKNDQAVPIL